MSDSRDRLTARDVEAEGLADWRMLFDVLHARFETGGFNAGVALVRAIAEAADELDHHPDLDLSYPRLDVRLTSHDVHGVTSRDVVLARTISELAAAAGATARPAQTSVTELALDTWDADELRPFYVALLGYVETEHANEVRDPDGKRPTVWFQRGERPDDTTPPDQRWHLDVRVPPEVVEERIQACLAAGGTLVADDEAPAFWVLADPQGNRSCLTTWQGRD